MPRRCAVKAKNQGVDALLWFVAALIPMTVSQIVRLHQFDTAAWSALAALAAIPSARIVAFQRKRIQVSY
jgi:CAAX protease family protein